MTQKTLTTEADSDKLDRLTATVVAGFNKVDERFKNVDRQFDKIDGQFANVNSRFKKVDDRFIKVDGQFDRLTAAMINGFDRIDKKLETKADKADVNNMMKMLDRVLKKQEISDDERLVMGFQLERLNKWTHELANKIGHTLSA